MIHLPYGKMQRSPYVPLPVNLPGLLPRFGGGEVEDNSASSVGQAAPSPSVDNVRPSSVSGDLGSRFGDRDRLGNRQSRPTAVRSGTSACPPQQVPCYDCMVYIASNGQITKFAAEGKLH
ncbi:uncharacterized protein LOC124167981 [Ischnura elegans]|uniref:uncharacterized protein LOC124167981 n=1 Tax=Ischnura elegans TaxID=197161 RepID=UPI001ED8A9AD|nr:uncharacterized protein LOC124167981 [Ischnura elegans]